MTAPPPGVNFFDISPNFIFTAGKGACPVGRYHTVKWGNGMDLIKQSGMAMIAGLLAVTAGCQAQTPETLNSRLDALAADIIEDHPEIPSLFITVSAPKAGIEPVTSAGWRSEPETPDGAAGTFRIASVTKVFTAATILRLAEQGKLQLTDPISAHIAPLSVQQLQSDGYDPDQILVRQLMDHTAGIYDYAMSPQFLDAIFKDTSRRWTRAEQVAFAVADGEPLSEPGTRFSYSDTGYILLGEIIERTSGMPMAEAVAALNGFDTHGLNATYFETLEDVPEGAPARVKQYLGDVDTTNWDPSFDLYGGGGLISTTDDLARYFRLLLRGDLFEDKSTLAMALLRPFADAAENAAPHAALLTLSKAGNHLCWSHGGFFGTLVVYCPDVDITVAVAVNANTGGKNTAIKRAVQDAFALTKAATTKTDD